MFSFVGIRGIGIGTIEIMIIGMMGIVIQLIGIRRIWKLGAQNEYNKKAIGGINSISIEKQ